MSFVYHLYVIRMHSYAISMLLVCTLMPSVSCKKTQNFLIFQVLIYEINLIAQRSLKNLQIGPIVIYYVLNNNFFYTQLVFALQKNPYYGFLFWWDFDIPGFFHLLSVFSSEKFDIFHVLLFGVFDKSNKSFLYTEKNIKMFFYILQKNLFTWLCKLNELYK